MLKINQPYIAWYIFDTLHSNTRKSVALSIPILFWDSSFGRKLFQFVLGIKHD